MTSPKALVSCLALLICAAASSTAAVLFTDTYLATSNQMPNDQLANPGRQGGLLATLGYVQNGNVQIGNLTTLPPSPGSGVGNELLVAFGGVTYLNHNFSNETVPIEITFRGIQSSLAAGGPTDWVSLIIGNSTGLPFVNGASVSSILFRANGGTEVWDRGASAAGGSGFAPGMDVWLDYKVVLSDTAGTGSAFGSGGRRADYYSNGSLLGTLNITQLTAGDGYFGFAANRISGYDNLQIATIPEASSLLAGLAGLGCLVLLRRRK